VCGAACQELFRSSSYFGTVFGVNDKALTSVDFLTTVTPSILDMRASMTMGNTVKMMLWYDNEWSYSAQVIRVMEAMFTFNEEKKTSRFTLAPTRSLRALCLNGRNVVVRCDFNVPTVGGKVIDEFRIEAAVPTIKHILAEGASRVVLVSHFGRPNGAEKQFSVEFMVPILARLLDRPVQFLPAGVSQTTLGALAAAGKETAAVYLLENIRFHPEEAEYDPTSVFASMYSQLGDVLVADCFGTVHRSHTSVVHLRHADKQFGYGLLIEKECETLTKLCRNGGKKVLGIMGGARIADKQPMVKCLSMMRNTKVFVGGGLTLGFGKAMPELVGCKTVVLACDAYGAADLEPTTTPKHVPIADGDRGGFDIGPAGLRDLMAEIDAADIIFWNGCLGVVEDSRYRVGSAMVVDYLVAQTHKSVVIGGGTTASLFAGIKAAHVHLSTGGGALLALVESVVCGSPLAPGLQLFAESTKSVGDLREASGGLPSPPLAV
jgi:phosphoglycerate kinase